MTWAVLDGAPEAGAKLVFADNMYVYGPPDGPMTEETPQRAQGKKGRVRIEMVNALLGAQPTGDCGSRSAAPPTTTAPVAPPQPSARTS